MNERRERITHVFAGNPLDRGEVERRDEEWLAAQAAEPASRVLPMWQLNVPVSAEHELTWMGPEELRRLGCESELIFLGLLGWSVALRSGRIFPLSAGTSSGTA